MSKLFESRYRQSESMDQKLDRIKKLLEEIDPDCGYSEWLSVLMAIFHESKGSDEGFYIANEWSSKGRKYKGHHEVSYKWGTFKLNTKHPVTIGTLVMMARDA